LLHDFTKDGRQKDMYSIMKQGAGLVRDADRLAANTRKQEQQPTQFGTHHEKEESQYIKRARLYDDEQTKQALQSVTH